MWSNGKDEIQKLSGCEHDVGGDAQFRDLFVRRADKMCLSVLEVEDGNETMKVLEREQFYVCNPVAVRQPRVRR